MLADATVSILASLIGLVILALTFVALAVRSKGNQVVTWKGLGVTFEIKPCRNCPDKGSRGNCSSS